jgi:membrane-bound lytic murein transglycosylase C
MVPNRLAQSARPYLTIVKQQAERFGVDPDLVLAVIHTESYFNPFAKSGAPAYGLMQLVPTSGAKEAYAFVHHSAPRTVEPRELYQPEVNVELGTAYLHLLLTHHFNDLKDPLARIYASISAYNCGPRNTMKALVPLGGTAKVLPIGASAKQVYDALRVGTPQETRQYVQLVADRRSLWRQPGP